MAQAAQVSTPARPGGERRASTVIARVDGASLSLGGRPVITGASLSLHRGEIYALLGPNGVGKTSLMRALCGRLPLTGGSVGLGDPPLDPRAHAGARRLVALVPQEIALYPRLTVRENIEVFAALSGVQDHRGAADRVLKTTGLEALAGVLVGTLSGGQQRRVNIAAALVAEPQILLLDEPTVGIDLSARGMIHDVLLDLRSQGVAILMITHDFEQAQRLADRIGLMVRGRIAVEGSPAALLKEAFGTRQQVEAALAEPPDADGEAELRAFGLSPVDGRLLWTGLTDEDGRASQLLDRLQASRIRFRELRIREPGLDTLFREVAGDPTP